MTHPPEGSHPQPIACVSGDLNRQSGEDRQTGDTARCLYHYRLSLRFSFSFWQYIQLEIVCKLA